MKINKGGIHAIVTILALLCVCLFFTMYTLELHQRRANDAARAAAPFQSLADVEKEGRAAYSANIPANANPYIGSADRASAWLKGYISGMPQDK